MGQCSTFSRMTPVRLFPVTGMGFVCWDFSKVFSRTFRLDMAELIYVLK